MTARTFRTLSLFATLLALACAGSQTRATDNDRGSMEPLSQELDDLALLPGQLAAGMEPPEELGIHSETHEALVVEAFEEVNSLDPVAVTTEVEMLVEAGGERIPLRLKLMSYEDGLHIYGAETMTAYDEEGRACNAADAAAKHIVAEARAGRFTTILLDPESLGTELPSLVRMTILSETELFADLLAIGDVLSEARLLRARMGDEVVVFSRESQNLGLYQSVMRVDSSSEQLRVVGPPHVRVSRLDADEVSDLRPATK